LARSEYLVQTYGSALTEAMRAVKRAADPDNILNPGKIVDAPKMDGNLRYGADYQTHVWATELSFARNGGLDVAIEQCNGQGVCRKDTGVMCPSYQATREEMHSTRGRANLLRALIRGKGIGGEVRSRALRLQSFDPERVEATAAALDLCLACKGCKSECPSGVDMAKLKFAFQAEYYKTHRRQLRDYVFGYFHIAAGLAASAAPLTNGLMQMPPVKHLAARLLGITARRPFPKFSKKRARPVRAARHSHAPPNRKVIFLADAFARYIEPATEQAALDILACCGYDVHVLPVLGAGASFLSKGFIAQARRHATRVLDLLHEADPSHAAVIVGIEPPEIYALKHDYLDLLPQRAEEIVRRIGSIWLLDEFLLRSPEFDNLRVASLARGDASDTQKIAAPSARNDSPQKVQFHPHCHQRAEGPSPDGFASGTKATIELLRACGCEVELMDTGCCGMAGTFGYEAEHYDISMQVGELKLFPKIRELTGNHGDQINPGASIGNHNSKIIASGAACRLQIRQGTGVEAVHPVVIVDNFVKGSRT
jgi:Fe-S oxidoreductase